MKGRNEREPVDEFSNPSLQKLTFPFSSFFNYIIPLLHLCHFLFCKTFSCILINSFNSRLASPLIRIRCSSPDKLATINATNSTYQPTNFYFVLHSLQSTLLKINFFFFFLQMISTDQEIKTKHLTPRNKTIICLSDHSIKQIIPQVNWQRN